MRLLVILLLLTLPACASFEFGDLPHLDQWPPPAAEGSDRNRTLRVEVDGLPHKFVQGWTQGTIAALADSGRFDRVTADAGNADRVLRYHIAHARPGGLWRTRILMGVCAVSLGVIPAPASHDFAIEAEVLDSTGRRLGSAYRKVASTTWVGLLPLFALPFAGAGMGDLIRDTTRSITVEAVDAGWL